MRPAAVALIFLLSGCGQQSCTLTGQRPMLLIRLYFGRNIAGRAAVTESQWQQFAAKEIGRHFPDGFTMFDATGQWRNPLNGVIGAEATKVVEIALPAGSDVPAAVEGVAAAYKQQFHQSAVGIVSGDVCASF